MKARVSGEALVAAMRSPTVAITSPGRLTRAGTAAWALLGIVALILFGGWAVGKLMPVVLPFAVAVLLATLLRPVAASLEARGVRPGAGRHRSRSCSRSTVFGALIALILPPFIARLTDLGSSLQEGVQKVAYSAGESLAGMDRAEVDRQLETAADRLRERAGGMAGDARRRASARCSARSPASCSSPSCASSWSRTGAGCGPGWSSSRRSRAARRSTRAAAAPGPR